MPQSLPLVVLIILGVIALFLSLLAVLMPYFVWQIHENVEMIRQALEKKPEEDETSERPDVTEARREALEANSYVLAALVEQQRTINALRQRLDELQGAPSDHQPGEPDGEFAPGIPLGQELDELDEKEPLDEADQSGPR